MAKRTLSRKEMEEMKKRQDEEAAAEVFQKFVEEFQEDSSKVSKVWVKAGTYDAGARKEDTKEKGKLYKPTSKLAALAETFSTKPKKEAKDVKESKDSKTPKRTEKRKSNLELFKEELRAIQEEREERHRIKSTLKTSRFDPAPTTSSGKTTSLLSLSVEKGSFDVGDPNTTNIYLGNINPKMTEQQLMDVFGKYGPLASVKVMWPRTEEEKARNRNCGFVAYMCRKDAERAMRKLNGKEIMGFEMKLGWGKALPIPARPIFVPPVLLESTLPPPPTGLPFNAVPAPDDVEGIPPLGTPYPKQGEALRNFNKILSRAVVKVVIPTERNLLCLIHRMVEFVIREGPMFEAMMMNKEIDNPQFRFLFDNRTPAHIYYRWKLFSVLQGDPVNKWRTEDFRMFKGGSTWRPPSLNPFAQGMPDDMFSSDEEDDESRRRSLSKSQKKRMELMLRKLTPERSKVTEAMIFCIEHAEASDEIIDFIAESLNSVKTALPKKLGRFYLISDVLYNSSAKALNASNFRSGFQNRLVEMVTFMHQTYDSMESRLKAEAFKQRVILCFRAWQEWNVYPPDFLIHLQNVFLGLASEMPKSKVVDEDVDGVPLDEDLDGAPLSDSEDLDGVPLDGAALLRSAVKLKSDPSPPIVSQPPPVSRTLKMSKYVDDDVDGEPKLNKKREDQEKLATRVAALESKLLTGTASMAAVSPNTSFEDVTKQQKLTLEKRRQEIIERERREREMRQQLEAQDEEVLDFKENFTSLQQEIEYKTRKLRKMYAKWQSVKQEMSDLSVEFRQQRQELEQAQEVLLKELRLKQVLINHFIPTDFKQQVMARVTYDDEEDKWVLKPSAQAPMLPLICSSRMDLRPTSEYEKHSRLSEDQSTQMGQYRFENILLLGLDIPPRSTKDYVAPEVSPTLQAALTEALHNRNAVVQVEARKFSSGADIHAFLKSACGRKLNQRSKSRNKLNSPSHKRHPQGYTPDGTSAAVQASYPRTRGLIPK